MTSFYEQILSPFSLIAAENTTPYEAFTERHLQVIWYEQKYFATLTTIDGEKIEVISPGIWNTGAGPDFTKAHLRIGKRDIRGDVELHLVEEGWAQHGHREDPRYNEVVLHIALYPSGYSAPIFKQNHESVSRVILEQFLTIPLSRIFKLIDLDLYPYKKFLGSGKCAQTLFSGLKSSSIENLFHEAALWRLQKKWDFLAYRVPKEVDTIPAGCAMALGYKHNADQFFQLYLALKKWRDLPIDELMALTLGMAGFFEEKFQRLWGESEKYNMFRELWGGLKHDADHQANLVLHQVRPFNHPVRRLASLAYLLGDPKTEKLASTLEDTWNQIWPTKLVKDIYASLTGIIPVYSDAYWNHHYTFEACAKAAFLPMIGKDLKREILVNAFLPFLYRQVNFRRNLEEQEMFETFYHWIPSSKSSKAKYLIHRFFGETPKGKCLSKVDCEQGAFQLHYDFCRHYEASCIGCPFVDRYKGLTEF